ncbi:hypothetical protein KIN20_009735 [Parelaphostrongylus tenuis]|uniref:Uncharacterized protein n=1 Tax=Parelaphostrongylus tenuis TaxID=148309 RepID=A0AAD5M6U6_PARTN|nr:hypothetical protein KIN20_009735 [Parelaphostrongylus tenuis]
MTACAKAADQQTTAAPLEDTPANGAPPGKTIVGEAPAGEALPGEPCNPGAAHSQKKAPQQERKSNYKDATLLSQKCARQEQNAQVAAAAGMKAVCVHLLLILSYMVLTNISTFYDYNHEINSCEKNALTSTESPL